MIEIIPAIIAKSYDELEEKVRLVEPYVERVHVDIMDGRFVDNETIKGYKELLELETGLKLEVHLMVSEPENTIDEWLQTKADKYLLHIESTSVMSDLVDKIKDKGHQAGMSLNPQTPNSDIGDLVDKIDLVQFMTVNPGFYGSPFVEDVLDKMTDFHFVHPDLPIQVDGGINPDVAPKVVQAGASILVSGSYIYNSKDVGSAIQTIQDSINP